MKQKPILFNSEMVNAILAGRKTQTRRVIKNQSHIIECKYGKPGDLLWVRETCWRNGGYVATDSRNFPNEGKVPSIFMPRSLSRITLEITDVRVERVQEISDEDAIQEGVFKNHVIKWPDGDPGYMHDVCIRNFSFLWNSINKKRGHGWDENPWVWVIEFKELEKV